MRRIVTSQTTDTEDDIMFDDTLTEWQTFGLTRACNVWVTDSSPPDMSDRVDATLSGWQLDPPVGGTAFRISVHQPGELVAEHTTDTVDYVVVVDGEMTLLLGSKEVVLRPGDTVVQRGTRHGWANRSDKPCTLAAVLLSGRA